MEELIYNGITFTSIPKLAQYLKTIGLWHISQDTLYERIRYKKMSVDDAINTPVRKKENSTYTYKGITYPSLLALAKSVEMDDNVIRNRMSRDGMTLEQAIETPTSDKVEYNGQIYPSLKTLCRILGVSYSTIKYKIKNQGLSVQEALDAPIKTTNSEVTYKGVKYSGLRVLCNELGLAYGTIYDRVKRGMSLEEAIELNVTNYRTFIPETVEITSKQRTVLYDAWRRFNNRCYDVNNKDYHLYGGRGIGVYPEWKRGPNNPNAANYFIQWALSPNGIGIKPEDSHESGYTLYSLDRINNNGNYEPGNLRWATSTQQANNKNSNNVIVYKGITYNSLSELHRSLNLQIELKTLLYRVNEKKMSLDEAINTPLDKGNSVVYNDVKYDSHSKLADAVGISKTVLARRLNSGLTPEEAVNPPTNYNSNTAITYKGVTYQSLKALCNTLGVNYKTVGVRMTRDKMTLEQAIEKPVKDVTVTYKGVTYSGVKELCTKLGLSFDTVASRVKMGWEIEKAVETPVQDHTVVYKGVKYGSLKKLCSELGLSYDVILRRVNEVGMSVEEAVGTPIIKPEYKIDNMVFGDLNFLTRVYGFKGAYDNNTVPRDELISYILNYRNEYPDEFTTNGVRFKTKRMARQLSLISNKLYIFKLNDDAFKLIDMESLTVEEKEAVLNTIKAIETVNPNNSDIETEIIKDKAFLYGYAESIIVKVGDEKLYLISFSDIKTK